jgi:hypothetical protein
MAICLTMYTKPGCHLCEIMAAVVRHVGRTLPVALEEIDITTDDTLLARYEAAIPVLALRDREIARYRITDADLRRILMQVGGEGAGRA